MRIVVDRSRCSSIGMCEAIASDLFEIRDDGVMHILHEDIGESRRADLERACSDCPTQSLRIIDGPTPEVGRS